MNIDLEKRKTKSLFEKTVLIFGVISILVVLLLVVMLASNELMFKNYRKTFYEKISNFIGNEDTSVTSFSDLGRFIKGAAFGLVDSYDIPQVRLEIAQEEVLKLVQANLDGNKKWVDGKLILGGDSIKLKGRLRNKGDRELHSESVDRMSYRFNLKGEDRLFGLEEFSIQSPVMRGYSWEFLIEKILHKEGVITLKSEPIQLNVNGDDRGIYMVEEVPNARTLERNKRKDGPIFGLDENVGAEISTKLDVYDLKKWESNSIYKYSKKILYSEFDLALNNGGYSSEHFDMKEWAKYFAMNDLFGTLHATVPKSVKFYFNPVIGKFQPVLFDAHKGAGKFKNFILLDFIWGEPECEWVCGHKSYYLGFMKNQEFFDAYTELLAAYSKESFIKQILEEYKNNIEGLDNKLYSKFSRNDQILYRGISFWLFKPSVLSARGKMIRKKLEILKDRPLPLILKTTGMDNDPYPKNNLSSIQVPNGVTLATSRDIKIDADEIKFLNPTVWVLEGENLISNSNKSKPVKIIGPVMIVQLGGHLNIGNLEILNGVSIKVPNRNWSGTLNLLDADILADRISVFSNDSEDAINFVNSKFNIKEISVRYSKSDAIDFDFSRGKIASVICDNIGNDCLDGSETSIEVDKVGAINVKDKIMSAGENSQFSINDVSAKDSAIGLVAKDGSSLMVNGIRSSKVDLFAAVFNKKPEYKHPILDVKHIYSNNDIEVLQDKRAHLKIYENRVFVNLLSSKNIESMMYGSKYGVATKK